jgi:intracellular sulfur oxidation DsrE/DsrF family protein
MHKVLRSAAALVLASCFVFGAVQAQAAEKKVVLQISDASPAKQTLVLNVANNLLKAFPDNVKIEVVAFGPGLRLLFADNANYVRVQSLTASGVRFSACQNTMRHMTKLLGHPPKLEGGAVPVSAGIGRILELTEQGYTLVRP